MGFLMGCFLQDYLLFCVEFFIPLVNGRHPKRLRRLTRWRYDNQTGIYFTDNHLNSGEQNELNKYLSNIPDKVRQPQHL